ncbi:MAG: hypothetical protein VB094_00030 [Oscillibacter sp.]|nr:hypothetical protein [Oscillibacter sp.]
MTKTEKETRTLPREETTREREQTREQKSRSEPRSALTPALRAVFGGVPLRELPPRTLKELATFAGNSGMLALAELNRSRPELSECPPLGGGGTGVPFEISALACPLAAPAEFPTEAIAGGGCDPAALGAWRGGP